MFHLAFFVLLLSTSTQLVDGLICATNCDFSTHINNVTFPSCHIIDKPSTDQSCRVELTINYASGSIVGRLDAQTPPQSFLYFMHTIFSLYDETSNVTIQFDCFKTNNCDQDFVKQVLRGDWLKVQNQVKDLRKDLADILFNSSDFRPHEICPALQNCSGKGFCRAFLQVLSGGTSPGLESTCANSTEEPLLDWAQVVEEDLEFQELSYTCNKPSCASLWTTALVGHMIDHGYALPFHVPTTPTTTPTPSSTTGVTTTSAITFTSLMSTSTKNVARSIHLVKIEKIIFYICLSSLSLLL
jgi:hypothetical protein